MSIRIVQAMAGSKHGGAEAFFIRLCIALNKIGIEQTIITRPTEKRVNALRNAGIKVHTARFGNVFDMSTRKIIASAIDESKSQIVLTWMNRATKHCPKSNKELCFKHIGRLGGYYNLKYYKNCDYLVGNTLGICNWLNNNGWPDERIKYLPNFVLEKSSSSIRRSFLRTPEDVSVVLAAGRFHYNKGFDILIKAISRLKKVHLWLAGDGPIKKKLLDLSKELNVNNRVHFLGWREDMSALYASADLFVCSSRHEPLGNVILEAWAHGLPVLSSNVQGPSELISNGENGILVPADNHLALYSALGDILYDKKKLDQLGLSGKSIFEQKFSEKIVVGKFNNFFESLVS